MNKSKKSPRPNVHFIGIGGIGMSALARYFLSLKWSVSGSDAVASSLTESLTKEAINVKIGHKKGNLPFSLDLMIISQAVRPDNPELVEARRRGVRILTYPEAVGELTEQYKTIAIAGAHGKSTTTALSALTLIAAGFDPTVIVGTKLKELKGENFRRGKSNYLVLEADEFGKAFLNYSPFISIVTNVDREHLDVYKNLSGVKKNFLLFLARTRSGGTLILNRDDKNLYSLRSAVSVIARKKGLRVIWYSIKSSAKSSGAKKMAGSMKIFGDHNLSNATAAHELGRTLKIPEAKIVSAIGSFKGAWRRMEFRGNAKIGGHTVRVFDDYAHHPTEIKASLAAFCGQFPKSKIICVFQPHQAKRLTALFKEFQTAFGQADATILLPLYKVTGRDEKITHDSEALVHSMEKRASRKTEKAAAKKIVIYLDNPKKLKATIAPLLSHEAVIIMMGAGNIIDYTDSLLQ
jgi:UDP-N-acetylmuramate--alanine ligase